MNICMVISAHFPPREGMGFYVWNLSRYLTTHGHTVQIITRGAPDQPFYEKTDGITIWRPFFAPVYPFHVQLHGIFVSKLVRKLESEVDLFHSHSPLIPPIKTSRPIVLTFHSMVRDDIQATKLTSGYTLLMKLQVPFSYGLEVENLKTATLVNAVSPRVVEALQKYPHSPSNVPVVWNGVDTDIFKPNPENQTKNGFILVVGRVGPGKGLEDLIDAVSSISNPNPTIHLMIVGDGSLRNSLEQRANVSGLKGRVHFEGHISDRNRLIDLYQKASLFVMPSHHEGLPTVILEAMACGCPVLATDVGGVPCVIEDGINGMLIPPHDPTRMAAAIQSLLKDPQKLNDLGMQARQTIDQRFSWNKIGAGYVDLYSRLLQG
jgi:glycosyltransferase involved in cell wall biosynthesis